VVSAITCLVRLAVQASITLALEAISIEVAEIARPVSPAQIARRFTLPGSLARLSLALALDRCPRLHFTLYTIRTLARLAIRTLARLAIRTLARLAIRTLARLAIRTLARLAIRTLAVAISATVATVESVSVKGFSIAHAIGAAPIAGACCMSCDRR
jgi:hypothetical protein